MSKRKVGRSPQRHGSQGGYMPPREGKMKNKQRDQWALKIAEEFNKRRQADDGGKAA